MSAFDFIHLIILLVIVIYLLRLLYLHGFYNGQIHILKKMKKDVEYLKKTKTKCDATSLALGGKKRKEKK